MKQKTVFHRLEMKLDYILIFTENLIKTRNVQLDLLLMIVWNKQDLKDAMTWKLYGRGRPFQHPRLNPIFPIDFFIVFTFSFNQSVMKIMEKKIFRMYERVLEAIFAPFYILNFNIPFYFILLNTLNWRFKQKFSPTRYE